ncbi:PD-(D/E)XK nuclease family protein [Hymenobacter sp. HMF4947]|uniref:PD-(D/E)XK nuclease family protein n=1 Tax=Hymenobacter ginkgonis TaxID=2682976 RepID=A0A7K1TK54_9BACT|nr:PD-(D/E)XK nuclease family protein [Hymenobacter ginkgonis]MVN78743.1 PD-(D/E)XK nuclease family protein [Hymenobacter ginkgonis]
MLPSPTLARPLKTAPAATPSFLAEVAHELLTTYDDDTLADLVVVVPTRRAVVYLKNELALATPDGQALWAPRIAAMEDYMVERAGVQIEEPIALQLLLFDIFKAIDPDLVFDQFVGWGGLLLQDFSSLDQNLTDTRGVFKYLAEAKALERWQLDPDLKTTGLDRYFGFWGQLHRVYLRFKKLLKKDHLAYPGLAYRRAVQGLRAELADPKKPLPATHVFVGLGGLSKAEETFISLLRKVGRAELYFDGDPFYLEDDSPNRAGQALRGYWRQWNLPRDTFTYQEHLRGQPHHLRLLGVANASMQGKLAGQLLAEARQLNPDATVAVVLPDETLLLPVLHGLPPAEIVPDFNVTMGLSFQSTALFNLVDLLFEVHLTGIREGEPGKDYGVPKYHHLAVSKLLAHPFLRRYQQYLDAQTAEPQFHGLLDSICHEIVRKHLVLLPATELLKLGHGHPLIEALFQTWDNCDNIIKACYTLINLLKQVYETDHTAIEAEYLYLFYTLVRQLDSAFSCQEQRLSVRSFRRFLYEQMRRTRLPFAGEPLAQVQIMGLLETRALDFDHVIILSCNENTLPPPKRQNSLFPYDVLAEFKLPTYADAEANAAYNFWRLLQRAGRVDLVHVLPGAEGVRTGERSRFLRQLEFDLAAQNPALVVEDKVVEVEAGSASATGASPLLEGVGQEAPAPGELLNDLVLHKDDLMLAALRGVLERGLSPSALNEYLACSLKFYFSRLARFQENEEVEEALGADGFGTVVHDALEHLLKPFELEKRDLTAADLPDILKKVPAEVNRQLRQEEADRQARPDDGLNHVLGQVAVRLIRKYLESLPGQPGVLPLRIVAQETDMAATVFVDLPGEAAPLAMRLRGRADRIDGLPDGRRRVVDYKTGLVEKRELNLRGTQKPLPPADTVERLLSESSSGADKVRQLWLYRFMLESDLLHPAPPGSEAAILSMRKIDEGLLSAPLDFITEGTGEPDFLRASATLVARLARRILDPAEPIRKTDDLAKCEYCPYRSICAR